GLVALWREKTFPALALTVLFLVLYLCLVQALARLPFLVEWFSAGDSYLISAVVESWQKWLDPFLALSSVLEPPLRSEPGLASAYGFGAAMLVLSVLLNAWAILRLRIWNPSGEPIIQRERPEEEEETDRAKAHAAPGPVRRVWANPILWREMRTRAYGRWPFLVQAAYYLVFCLICYWALAPLWTSSGRMNYFAARGLVPLGILSLLLVSVQAATAITSERDAGALDLLLVTDLTPREFIFGKLWGILYNTKSYILLPLVLVGVYAAVQFPGTNYSGTLATPPRAH